MVEFGSQSKSPTAVSRWPRPPRALTSSSPSGCCTRSIHSGPVDHRPELARRAGSERQAVADPLQRLRARKPEPGEAELDAGSDPQEPVAHRGHFHSDFAKFWVVMLGDVRWTFDGDVPSSIVATQGDIVYAPPKTWHAPQFWGEQGLNCRPHQQHVSFGESSLRPDAMRRWNGTDFDGLDHVGARPHLLDVRDGVARRSRYQVRMSRGMKPSALRHPSE
jgi:mannose-6-phosphate isomerase-like protein (cupin superfamily)